MKFKLNLDRDISVKDVISYFVGTTRSKVYDTKFEWLIRKHIREQIAFRLNMMKTVCYKEGVCQKCGCNTPALQMAKKSCKGDCYPPLMCKFDWEIFCLSGFYTDVDTSIWQLYYNKSDKGRITATLFHTLENGEKHFHKKIVKKVLSKTLCK